MKKIIVSVAVCIFCFVVLGCPSAIMTAKTVGHYDMTYANDKDIFMEFIGYKGDATILSTASTVDTVHGKTITVMSPYDQWKAILQSDSLRKMGTTLQNKNIAYDKAFAYFGIYSLQELELYKAQTRYVTFIEVAKNMYTVADNSLKQNFYGGMGAVCLGGGILYHIIGAAIPAKEDDGYYTTDNSGIKSFFHVAGVGLDIAGLAYLIAGGKEAKTRVQFEGNYNIYIYDTERKEIIYKDLVTVNSVDEFNGSYFYDERSKSVVHEYYGTLISNALLKKYDEIIKMLALRQ